MRNLRRRFLPLLAVVLLLCAAMTVPALAAKVLAGSVADLMEDKELLDKARAEFNVSAAGGYDCPIEKGVIPGPQAL